MKIEANRTCPVCRTLLQEDAPLGWACPRCLMELGLEDSEEESRRGKRKASAPPHRVDDTSYQVPEK